MGKKMVQSLIWFCKVQVDGFDVSRQGKIGRWQSPGRQVGVFMSRFIYQGGSAKTKSAILSVDAMSNFT